MTTKWDVLNGKERKLLADTAFDQPCAGCGVNLPTEAAFARHFIVPDLRYLNLGYCPETGVKTAVRRVQPEDAVVPTVGDLIDGLARAGVAGDAQLIAMTAGDPNYDFLVELCLQEGDVVTPILLIEGMYNGEDDL